MVRFAPPNTLTSQLDNDTHPQSYMLSTSYSVALSHTYNLTITPGIQEGLYNQFTQVLLLRLESILLIKHQGFPFP